MSVAIWSDAEGRVEYGCEASGFVGLQLMVEALHEQDRREAEHPCA